MSVYPAKNARGEYTGVWVAEVMRQDRRFKAKSTDFGTAKRIEALFLRGEPVPEELLSSGGSDDDDALKRSEACTLRQLIDKSSRRLEGNKDRVGTLRCLDEMVRLLGPETPVEKVRYADLEKAASALIHRGFKSSTVNRYIAAISGTLKWARKNDIIDQVPSKPWRRVGRSRKIVVPHSADNLMHGWFLNHNKPALALIYGVLASTALRINELLTLAPVEIEGEWLRLNNTKNSDPRDVPINANLSAPLRTAIEQGTLPAYETIRRGFLRASDELGIGIRITPHLLRHTAATRLNSAGTPTATIQQFLGHRDIRTTLVYVHADRSALVEAAKHLNGPGKPW